MAAQSINGSLVLIDVTTPPLQKIDGVFILSANFVRELCGGEFPDSGNSANWPSGFAWDRCEYRLEEGRLIPCSGDELLPGPDLILTIHE